MLGDLPAAPRRDRRVRVLVELAAGDHRRPLVEQADEGADQPGLALAALAEQHEVVAGQQRALDLGQHGVVEADDAGEGSSPAASTRSRFSRISALTVRCTWPAARRAPSVVGRSAGGAGTLGGGRCGVGEVVTHCTLRRVRRPRTWCPVRPQRIPARGTRRWVWPMGRTGVDRATVLAVDVGGSKLAAALVDGTGRVVRSQRAPTPQGVLADAESLWTALEAVVDALLASSGVAAADLAGVGIGCGGPMAWPAGRCRRSTSRGGAGPRCGRGCPSGSRPARTPAQRRRVHGGG